MYSGFKLTVVTEVVGVKSEHYLCVSADFILLILSAVSLKQGLEDSTRPINK